MAPNPLDTVDESLKKTIHSLYTLQSSTHGFAGPETTQTLIQEIQTLSHSLVALDRESSQLNTSTDPDSGAPLLPPEVITYVDTGRNPDIYTREFVELVQRGNAYLKGKSEGLRMLRDVLAEEIVEAWPELRDDVQRLVGPVLVPARKEEEKKGGEGMDVDVDVDVDADVKGGEPLMATATTTAAAAAADAVDARNGGKKEEEKTA